METIENHTVAEKRLQEFVEYFVDEFDTRIEFYRKILEEKADPATGGVKTAALTGSKQAISGGVSFATGIPFLGPLVGAIYEQGGKKIVTSIEDKNNKKEANSLYELIFDYKGKEKQEIYKRLLINASYEIFYSFEAQFMNVTAEKGGETRAMLKLAKTIVTKIIEYFINNEENFTVEGILKSVINNEGSRIKKFITVFKLGREVITKTEENAKWSTMNIVTKCGVRIEDDNKVLLYTIKDLEPDKYGFRRLCSYENKDDIINKYTAYDVSNNQNYNYNLTLEQKDTHVERIYTILSKRDPKKMEDRFKDICENISKEIIHTIENIKLDENSLVLNDIKELLKKSEKDILNEICLYYIKNKNHFDEAKIDRQNKHDVTITKITNNNKTLKVIDDNLKETLDKVDYIHTHVKSQKNKPLFFQLPQFKTNIVGHQNELNEIKEAHLSNTIVVINGFKGLGKTALAKKYVFDKKLENNMNIIWLSCINNQSMVYAFRDLALLLGFDMSEKTNLEIIEEIFSHFETKKTLFVFDNCKENTLLVSDLQSYFNINNNISVIITTTNDNCNENYHVITLQKWSKEEAVEYIKSIFHKELAIEITNNDEDYEKLAEFHNFFPIRLYHATAYIVQQNNLHKEIFTIDDYIMIYSQKQIPVPVAPPQNDEDTDDDTILNKVEKEAERFGDRVSEEADRFGTRVSNEADRIGSQISNEAARAEARVTKFFKNEVGGFFKKW